MDAHLWDERYAAADLVWSGGPNQFVAAECADLTPGRAVDLAAGEGRNAIWLAQQGWQVTAVDFSQVGLDKGRRVAEATGTTGVEWICADATTFVPAEPVDLVVIAYLQVPAADRLAAVTGAVRALRPGGTLLWVSHDATNIAEGTGGPQDPSVLMSAEDVLADVESSGVPVDVARAERVARLVESGDHRGEEQRTAWDALVRLTRR
ncbi:MAG: class I SAM-dependent methyltransferase [Nocardioides sp.]|nr:class I SAM-dependent methyltransferase [Nocardioides sp.]